MKKLLFVLVILAVLLSACGEKQAAEPIATEQPAPTQPPVEQPTAAPATGEAVEISMMMWGSPEELGVWQAIVDEFEALNPNIKVSVEVSDWDGYWEKLKVLFASNTPPDIFAMDAPLFPDWQSRNALLNLQSYIDATPGFLDDFYPITLQNYKLPDGYYGLPRDFQTIVMYYNKDMFDAANVPYPKADWTYDDLRQVALQLTKDLDGDGVIDQWGFSADLWDMELFWSSAIWAYGGEVISADYTKTLIGDEKARQAWQFIHDMIFTDKSMPDPDAAAEYGGDMFAAGKVAMLPIGHWTVPEYSVLDFKFDVAPMPKGPAGQATSVNSAGFVIAKESKHPDAAWEFLKFALSPTGQTRLAELGFAIPVLKSVAQSPAYLEQSTPINHQVFLDSLAFAHLKPAFRGYDQWATLIGDGMYPIWTGEQDLNEILDALVPQADDILAQAK